MNPNHTSASHGSDLRHSRRQQIERLVTGQLVESGAQIKICDISAGGFAMETRCPVRVGEVLAFRFAARDGSAFLLRASVAHTRPISGPTGPVVYWSGLEFAARQTVAGRQAIKILLEKVERIMAFPRSVPA
jgi:hypothetical protein